MSRTRAYGRTVSTVISQAFMAVTTIIIVFPLYFMFTNAFKSRADYLESALGLPSPVTLENIAAAFAGKDFLRWFYNSTVLTVFSTIITLFVAFMAGYAFAKMNFRGKNFLFKMIVPLMSVPPIAMIIPQFKLVNAVGLSQSLSAVILIYVGIMLPMTIYLYRNFMISIPDSLIEAAQIDGCSSWKTLWVIVMPLTIPAMITYTLVNLVWVWNELVIALVFLQDNALRTLMVGITLFKNRYTLNIPVIMAGLVIVTVPLLIVYIFAQRRLVEGLLSGSLKE
jgi:ABC-type glycerol-3-phosphate transport system permease component